ncbi:sugar ABC transporter ATP-binding protein [Umezawaea endophytica]|uniref:Sugar ABC transporter ATP-binding protein n=1 Tax=Umezawaea endophytica TaxID=1654476 RepID=A0A9X2ZXR3_9PSEU|nr:sugar ABC transporter ATP-binding protein [Umezawaea endophytica]MCS7475634.1 sugar ABC transporter ATP-binding protein [Umezawaea endophytica]
MTALVEATGLRKTYGTVEVLRVDRLSLAAGQVVALLGENGAGKSTLVRVLTGATAADAGRVDLAGRELRNGDPAHAQELGVATVSQEFPLVGEMSTAENLMLGRRAGSGRVVFDRRATERAAAEVLGLIGADVLLDQPVSRLSVAQQQLVEIAKALGRDPRVLVLDEPTSALGPVESRRVLRVARDLAAQGRAVIFIGHRLDEVREIADRVLVMRNGRLVADLSPEEATTGAMIRAMAGDEAEVLVEGDPPRPGAGSVLTVRGLEAAGIGPLDLDVGRGEILGVAGLMGSGRSRLVHALMGAARTTGGTMTLAGQPYAPRHPADAVRAGVGLVPEDRKRQSLLPVAPVRWNISLAALPRLARRSWLDPRAERTFTEDVRKSVKVRCATQEQPIGTLSGGNQQRAVFGRWFATEPRLLLLDEPTRGVDVGAKAEIYHLVESFAARGTAVVIASSELEELMRLAHRTAVLARGRLVTTIPRSGYSKHALMTAANSEGAAP